MAIFYELLLIVHFLYNGGNFLTSNGTLGPEFTVGISAHDSLFFKKIVQLNEEVIKGEINELVRGSVEETLNELFDAEAEKLIKLPGISAMNSARTIAAATTTAILPPLPEMSPSRCLSSKGSPLRPPLLSGTAAGRVVWKKPLLRCTWQEYLSGEWRTLPRPYGAARYRPPPSVN